MTLFGFPGRRALVTVAAGLFIAAACAVPDYRFIELEDEVGHCENNATEPDFGESDVDCGGTECRGCSYGQYCNESSDCAEGVCLEGICLEPGCENHELDGDETAEDCGGICPGCRDGQPCLTGTDCLSNVCGPEDKLCAAPSCEDGVRNGDELADDCGGPFCDGCGIGEPCVVPDDCQQSAACDDDTKKCVLNCARGTDECDGELDDPCETNLLTSTRNCGECGKGCNLSHAEASCVGGTCQIETCVEPWIRCNTDESDGCEVNASNDQMNCGGCGMVCPALHGSPSCVNSTCVIECEAGFGDCDQNALTGCEASVSDVLNCGSCGRMCPSDEGVPFCVDNMCGRTVCDPGTGDCDGDQVCETGFDDDVENCGRCGNVCSAANGSVECVAGVCVIDECDDGWENCDDDTTDGGVANGCETNTASDARNCGGCGTRCDVVENGSGTCQAGSCDLECNAGFEDCDDRVDTGCEANTTSDTDHCGGCGNDCNIPNAAAACEDSDCSIGDCLPNFEDCNSGAGCETNVSNSLQHCGSCGHVCSPAGATSATCSAGRCGAPSCDTAHKNCDGNNDNGCETDVTTPALCGQCGRTCAAATPYCVLTGNQYECQARITISNSLPYPTAQAVGNRLTFNATPHAGTNRLILLAVAAESQGNGLAGARPDSVRFGTQDMIPGPSQVGANDTWGPDLFIYYLPLGDSAVEGNQLTVTIDASTTPQATGIAMQDFQLNGVRQTMPITGSAGAFLGTSSPDAPDPSVIALTLPVAVSGSAIYSFISAIGMDGGSCTVGSASGNCPSWSVSPSANLTVTETMAMSPLQVADEQLRTFGMYVGASSASLPAAVNHTPRWSIPASERMTHLAVAIAPAQQ